MLGASESQSTMGVKVSFSRGFARLPVATRERATRRAAALDSPPAREAVPEREAL